MKKYLKSLGFAIFIFGLFFGSFVFAQQTPLTSVTPPTTPTQGSGLPPCTDSTSADCYQLLEPLPQKQPDGTYKYISNFNTGTQGKDDQGVAGFLNFIIEIAIGIAGVLGVVMLTIYGFQYASNDKNINTFAELRTKLMNVVFGLLLLLGIFLILKTINPDLLIVEPDIRSTNYNPGGDPTTVQSGQILQENQNFKQFAAANGINCPGSGGTAQIPDIARSMVGKITYSMSQRGQVCANNTFCLDCSAFVNAVYSCAGLPSPGGTTAGIFPGTEGVNSLTATTANAMNLNVGDLLGWMPGESGQWGHVFMYIGNGQTIESAGANKKPGAAVFVRNADAYGSRVKHIKRLR